MSSWYLNKQVVDAIPVSDRALQYGDGLFETIAIRGGNPRLWPLHLERLDYGCGRLGIEAPTASDLQSSLEAAISDAPVDTSFATAKIIISAGSGPRGYRRPKSSRARFWVGIFDSLPRSTGDYQDGIKTRLCQTRLAIQPQLAGIKSINRLEQVLARAEWGDDDIIEGLMRDTDDRIICGTMSNVFVITANNIATPAITRCGVSGIMRRHILTLLDEADLACDVRDIPAEELQQASEVFLTNSQFGVLPVARCENHRWSVGPLTQQVMALAADSGIGECAL